MNLQTPSLRHSWRTANDCRRVSKQNSHPFKVMQKDNHVDFMALLISDKLPTLINGCLTSAIELLR